MNGFLYILSGKAAVGDDKGAEDQIESYNTVTLTAVSYALEATNSCRHRCRFL